MYFNKPLMEGKGKMGKWLSSSSPSLSPLRGKRRGEREREKRSNVVLLYLRNREELLLSIPLPLPLALDSSPIPRSHAFFSIGSSCCTCCVAEGFSAHGVFRPLWWICYSLRSNRFVWFLLELYFPIFSVVSELGFVSRFSGEKWGILWWREERVERFRVMWCVTGELWDCSSRIVVIWLGVCA